MYDPQRLKRVKLGVGLTALVLVSAVAAVVATEMGSSVGVSLPPGELPADPRSIWLALAASMTQGWKPLLVAAAAGMVLVYAAITGMFEQPINARKLMNALVMLYAVTYFVPLLRPAFLAIPLVLLSVASRPKSSGGGARWIVPLVVAMAVTLGVGLWRGWADIDEVRSNIPLTLQLTRLAPFAHALLVYYVVKRNGWELAQFERFFKIVLALGLIVSIEAIMTFYLKIGGDIQLFGVSSVEGGFFNSIWLTSFHKSARIGMTVVFVALYFYVRRRQLVYLGMASLGFPLVFASLSRQSLIGLGVGLIVTVLLIVPRKRRTLRRAGANPLLVLLTIGGILAAGAAAVSVASDIRETTIGVAQLKARAVMWARGLDAFIYTDGFGTGPGLLPHYTATSIVPTPATDLLVSWLDLDMDEAVYILTRTGRLEVGAVGFTVHSVWLQIVYEWGVVGLGIVAYIIYHGRRNLVVFWRSSTIHALPLSTAAAVIFGLTAGVSFSILTTSKFFLLDYLVVLFLFVGALAREMRVQLAAQTPSIASARNTLTSDKQERA